MTKQLSAGMFLMCDEDQVNATAKSRARQEDGSAAIPVTTRRHLERQARDSLHHDLLIVPRAGVLDQGEFFRVPVVKDESSPNVGHYDGQPERWGADDSGQRKVMSVAFPHEHGPEKYRHLQRGPAFSTLPIKPEPASTSCAACYLVSAQNLNYPNLWTQALWSSPNSGDESSSAAQPTGVEVLLAAPRGKVLRLVVGELDRWSPEDGAIEFRAKDGTKVASLEAIDLQKEAEVWQQLRNGCVAGRVLLERENRIVPLVNVTSLQDMEPEPPALQ